MERKRNKRKALIKSISLTAVILTIMLLVLVIIYQATSGRKNLSNDLNRIFSVPIRR